jgi:hypothetical protein
MTETLEFDFFGIVVSAVAAPEFRAELTFMFEPHLLRGPRTPEPDTTIRLCVEFFDGGYLVRRTDGALLLRRPYHGRGNMPPAIPPFAVLAERFCLLPAVVLARGDETVALVGSPQSEKTGVGLALASRGWQFVSGQLLVLDRATRQVVPYQVPVELRGDAVPAAREAGLLDRTVVSRSTLSPVAGEVLLVRPESLAAAVPVHARFGVPRMIRLCRARGDVVRLERCGYQTPVWPPQAQPELADVETYLLTMPMSGGADESAEIVDRRFGREGILLCHDGSPTSPASRAG